MKKLLLTLIIIPGITLAGFSLVTRAQEKNAARYEYAIVKWDDPDRLLFNYPNARFELINLLKTGQKIPKDAENEEYCLAYACNFMALSGWEPVNLTPAKILFRRQKMSAFAV
jgi:hypothetical protein